MEPGPMTVLWDKIKKNIIDNFIEAIDKTEELTSVGRLKMEILRLEHHLDEEYTQLGRYVFKNFSKYSDVYSTDNKIQKMKNEINRIDTELQKKEKELYRIRKEDGIDFDR
jgi:hypothetical protein